MGKIMLINIKRNSGFVDDSMTTAVTLTYKVKKWYYFGGTKDITQVYFPYYSQVDSYIKELNEKLNIWRNI